MAQYGDAGTVFGQPLAMRHLMGVLDSQPQRLDRGMFVLGDAASVREVLRPVLLT